jgi:hypothetical protein
MAEANQIEQAVSRTLRDNLGKIQGASEELSQAINDLVSACASSRPANALPSMIRAQSCAASLSAGLEVLSRFVTSSLQPLSRLSMEPEMAATGYAPEPLPSPEQPRIERQHLITENPKPEPEIAPELERVPEASLSANSFSPMAEQEPQPEPVPDPMAVEAVFQPVDEVAPMEMAPPPDAPIAGEPVRVFAHEPAGRPFAAPEAEVAPEPEQVPAPQAATDSPAIFDVANLPEEERELHKRANRVAKVSMQDIVMLHPEDIRLGRENKDLCYRLRDDIEKAHREYGRRFPSMSQQPVDYFYDWMVEILAAGNAEALGQYPYPSPVLRR